ncbi:hypothetical protein R3P38DRAFT_3146383 [Favolaschia claudopus]|uniref:F-box domain-containing protein n=1 Tax=Favolaschia claudopus TaxID=2862362 RepID=A0AAV9Z399_9AGAR
MISAQQLISYSQSHSPPIYRIPNEVLCQIFCFTLWNSTRKFIGKLVDVAPWRLTHVCQTWRSAARGYSRLWSCFTIHFGGHHDVASLAECYPLLALETQIQLAYPTPLDVEIVFGDRLVEDLDHIQLLLDLLLCHSHRWGKLWLHWTHDADLCVLSCIEGRLDQLHSIFLDAYSSTGWEPEDWPSELTDLFADAPRLEKAFITDITFYAPSPHISAPWSQITDLRIHAASSFLLHVLRNAVNLVECAFWEREITDDSEATEPCGIITLPSLRRLSFTSWLDNGLSCIRYLHAPNVEYLELHNHIDAIPRFLQQSQCRISTVKFFAVHSVISVLAHLPFVTNLEFDVVRWGPCYVGVICGAFKALAHSSDLCPRLSFLRITRPRTRSDSDANAELAAVETALCDLLESRYHPNPDANRTLASLATVRIANMAFSSVGQKRVDSLQLSGLDIQGFQPVQSIGEDDQFQTFPP